METEDGLRERKRRHTRTVIAETAMRLFAQRGFDQVKVADIAEAAGVAPKTVYNYFPVKAAMFFDEADDVLAELLAAVRYRSAGESALAALRRFLAGRAEWAAGRRPAQPTADFRQLIADSPALRSYQRLMFGRYETTLADLLADETGADRGSVEPFVAAVALVAVVRAGFEARPGQNAVAGLDLLARGLDLFAVAERAPGRVC